MIHILENTKSILNQYLIEIRDKEIQQNRIIFRNNIERIGEILAIEISKTLDYEPHTVSTPLGNSSEQKIASQPIILSILRAGIPLHNGILKIFDKARSGFIAASRVKSDSTETKVDLSYETWPSLDNQIVILADLMLATGTSLRKTLQSILKNAAPKVIHVACVISYSKALEQLSRDFPNVIFWSAAVDSEMNEKNYITPGLGDAGDLAYGTKIQK